MSAPAVFRAEDAEALAEGWPHVRALRTSGSKKPAAARAARVLTKVDPVNVVWTREVALAADVLAVPDLSHLTLKRLDAATTDAVASIQRVRPALEIVI